MSFFFSCLSFFFKLRERERERVYKIGYKEKWSKSLLIFFSLMEFLWRIFPLLRANRLYAIFNTGLKNLAPSCPRYFLYSSTRSIGFGSVCHEPCPTTNFLIIYFHWREGVPTSVLGSQPIVWLLPSSFPCQATRVRSPSINICGSPFCDLHSFLTVILWRLPTVNSAKRIVVIIFLSSQWDTSNVFT